MSIQDHTLALSAPGGRPARPLRQGLLRTGLALGLLWAPGCFEQGSTSSGGSGGTGTDSGGSGGSAGTTGGGTSAGTSAGSGSSTSAGTSAGSGSTGGGVCGNGVVEAGESCDDGNDVDTDDCPSTCQSATCGDGFVQEGVEVCDDGNQAEDDTCNTSCRVSGTLVWSAVVADVNLYRDVTVGEDGTIYVTGQDAADDAVVAAYMDADTEVWRKTYDAGGSDFGRGVALDPATGSVVVAGYGSDSYKFGAFVLRYTGDGALEWQLDGDPSLGWEDAQQRSGIARQVVVDDTGDALVAGDYGEPGSTTYVARVWRIDDAGSLVDIYDTDENTGTCGEYWESIALAQDGDILLTGAKGNCPGSIDIMSERKSSGGTSKWIDLVDGDAMLNEAGRGVAAAGGGSVVGGFVRVGANDMSAWIRRYDADGNALWTTTHAGDADGYDAAAEVVEDAAGNLFAVGWETAVAGGTNGWIVKLDPSGEEIWSETLDEAGFSDYFFGLALDPAGDPVVVGSVQPTQGDDQAVILKFDR